MSQSPEACRVKVCAAQRSPPALRRSSFAIRHSAFGGFTLIELVIVVAVIAVLISILVPSLKEAREAAIRVVCLSRLKSLYLGFALYAEDYEGLAVPWGYNGTANVQYAITGSWWTGSAWVPGVGVGVAYPQYVTDYKLFYCPTAYRRAQCSSEYWDPTPYTSPGGGSGSLGYFYYAGKLIGNPGWTDNGLTVQKELYEPDRSVMGDALSSFMYSGHHAYISNHPPQDYWYASFALPAGGNFLYSDGVAAWSDCATWFGGMVGWVRDVYVDGQGNAISGRR